jgi:hypothetical protein
MWQMMNVSYNLKRNAMRKLSLRHYVVFIPGSIVVLLLLIMLGSRSVGGRFIYPLFTLFNHLNGFDRPTVLCLGLLACFFLVVTFVVRKQRRWGWLTVLLMFAAAYTTFGYLPPVMSKGWRELSRAATSSHQYRLVVYESASDGDWFELYPCDSAGFLCGQSLVKENNARGSKWTVHARLQSDGDTISVVDGDAVMYKRADGSGRNDTEAPRD